MTSDYQEKEISNKSFNEQLHKTCDLPARAAMLRFFEGKGIEAIENPDKYDIDILVLGRGKGYELERRHKWTDGEYPYPLVNLLGRKEHLFNGEHPFENHYVIFNNDCTQFIHISEQQLHKYLNPENLHIENCFVPSEGWRKDYVYKIPREEFKSVKIENN